MHAIDRWTIAHRDDLVSYPPVEYQFGTNGFRSGTQTDLIARSSFRDLLLSENLVASSEIDAPQLADRSQRDESATEQPDRSARSRNRRYPSKTYLHELTKFAEEPMPKLTQLATDIMNSIPPKQRTVPSIARAMERHLSEAGLSLIHI